MHLWSQGSTLPSFELYSRQLDALLSGHALVMLMIELPSTHEPIGFVYAYDYNPYDKYVFWTIALHPAYMRVGWGAEASWLFLNYLFTYFDIHKACSEHYAFNQHSMRILIRCGAVEEGRFRAHRYYQGGYHDVIRVASWRDAFVKTSDRVLKMFTPPKQQATRPSVNQGTDLSASDIAVVDVVDVRDNPGQSPDTFAE